MSHNNKNIEMDNYNEITINNNEESNQFITYNDSILKKYNFKDFPKDISQSITEDKNKDNTIYSDLSRYKSFKIFNMKIYCIGNTYTFGYFNFFSEPLFSLDNKWYLHFIIYLIELIIYYLGNNYFFNKIEQWKQTTFNILLITFFIIYNALIFINPGIVIKNKNINANEYKYKGVCRKCNIIYNRKENIMHCYDCNLCVKRYDHHCHVVRKCITRRNIILFSLMITNFVIIYLFFIINFFIYIYNYYKNNKKK